MWIRRILRPAMTRFALWIAVLLTAGLFAAALVRMAPGFGMDERLLDTRLSARTREAIERQTAEQRNVLRYYATDLARLARGDRVSEGGLAARPAAARGQESLGQAAGTPGGIVR